MTFQDHVKQGLAAFGMTADSEQSLSDGLVRMDLTDTVHSGGYVALIKEKNSPNPAAYWKDILDGEFKDMLHESAFEGEALPASIILPSSEAEVLIELAAARGIRPTVYQLFEGYVTAGFNRRQTTAFIEENPPASIKMDEPLQQAENRTRSPKKAIAAVVGLALLTVPFLGGDNAGEENPQTMIDGSPGNPQIMKTLAANAPLGEKRLDELHDEYLRELLANPHASAALLQSYAGDPDENLRAAVAANSSAKPDSLEKLSHDPSAKVRAAAASNPALSSRSVLRLAKDPDMAVRAAAYNNPAITWAALKEIEPATCAEKENYYSNSCIPSYVLGNAARSSDECVHRGVAGNINTSPRLLTMYLGNENEDIRMAAVRNPSLPVPALEGVAIDKSYPLYVRQMAFSNSAMPEKFININLTAEPALYAGYVARNPSISEKTAAKIYRYASDRGGMPGLFRDAQSLADTTSRSADIYGGNGGSNALEKVLRQGLNASFSRNLYNPPLAAAKLMQAPQAKASELFSPLAAPADGGEFFDDAGELDFYLEDSYSGRFGEMFEDIADENTPVETQEKVKAMLDSADEIVDGLMEVILPIAKANSRMSAGQNAEGAPAASNSAKGTAPASGNGAGIANSASGGAYGMDSSNAGGSGSSARRSVRSVPELEIGGRPYVNSCKVIEELYSVL